MRGIKEERPHTAKTSMFVTLVNGTCPRELLHQPPNQRLPVGGRFLPRIMVTVVSTSSGSRTSSSTTTSTEVVRGMWVVEEEVIMLGVGDATRRVLDGDMTLAVD